MKVHTQALEDALRTYKTRSLREVINELRLLADGAKVEGFESSVIHSDRGWYDRNALTPGTKLFEAKKFADELEEQIGDVMHGWKGGDYPVREDMPIAYANHGDTGPYIAGFVLSDFDGPTYDVITVDGGFW